MIGIDLGTSNSAGCFVRNGRLEMIKYNGEDLLPSYVLFQYYNPATKKIEPAFGKAVKNRCTDPENMIFGTKRLIGRPFNHPKVQEFIAQNPQLTIINNNGKPEFRVSAKDPDDESKVYYENISPERVGAEILAHIKSQYKAIFGKDATHAVITVPAKFDTNQRAATKSAALMAGFQEGEIEFISEPTAAAYLYKKQSENESPNNTSQKTVLIFDFGAGTLDCSIVRFNDKTFNVLAVAGNTDLGGEDFDNIIINWLLEKFQKSNPNVNPSGQSIRRLKKEAEEGKIRLSNLKTTTFVVDSFVSGYDLSVRMKQSEFRSLIADKLNEATKIIDDVLKAARITKDDISAVIPIGGSCYIPAVKELLMDYFDQTNALVVESLEFEHAVAQGAALIGEARNVKETISDPNKRRSHGIAEMSDDYSYSSNNNSNYPSDIVQDVLPSPIGVEVAGGKFFPFVGRGRKFPISIKYPFKVDHTHRSLSVSLYQGDGQLVKDNTLIKSIIMDNIPPNIDVLWVTITMDSLGRINLVTKDDKDIMRRELTVECNGKLSEEEINEGKEKIYSRIQEEELKNNIRKELDQLIDGIQKVKKSHPRKKELGELQNACDDLYVIIETKGSFNPNKHLAQFEDIKRRLSSFISI